jgi:hypothetical protein
MTCPCWYSYDPDQGVIFHATEAEAREAAEYSLRMAREACADMGGWCSEYTGTIEWGELVPRATTREIDLGDGRVDYRLEDVSPAVTTGHGLPPTETQDAPGDTGEVEGA